MKTYFVMVTRDCTESTQVSIVARNREAAKEKALLAADLHSENFLWEIDDCSRIGDPYLADPDACVEEAGR